MTISITSPTSTTSKIQQNGNDVLTVDSSNNVTVINNLSVSGTVSSTGAITFDGGVSGDVNFDSGTLYVDSANNRVGIGTTSPSSLGNLVVSAVTDPVIALEDQGAWNASIKVIGASGALTFNNAANTERMRIDSSGNVGIGTSSPAQLLEVKKDQATSTRIKVTNKTNNAASTAGLLFENSTSDVAYVQLWDAGTIGALTAYGLNIEGTGSGGANLVASNASGVIRFATGGTTERMRIDSSGNVSITQTPGKYTVDTSGGATSIANGGTVDFPNASGMLVVNNHSNGHVTIWLCGAGATGIASTLGTQVGTFAHVAGINGYRWTNNYGSTATFGFFFVRTRTGA